MKPTRKAASLVPNSRGNALSQPGQGSSSIVRKQVTATGKQAYTRKTAGVDPTTLKFHRDSEGSVLTPGSARSGSNVQPYSNKGQKTSVRGMKGVD